jgi:hypothetical protein
VAQVEILASPLNARGANKFDMPAIGSRKAGRQQDSPARSGDPVRAPPQAGELGRRSVGYALSSNLSPFRGGTIGCQQGRLVPTQAAINAQLASDGRVFAAIE